MEEARLDARHARANDDRDAPLGENTLEASPERGRERGQNLVRAGHQREGEAAGVAACVRGLAAQAALQGEQQFNAACAGPDERNARAAPPLAQAGDQRLQAGQEVADRLDRDGVLRRAGDEAACSASSPCRATGGRTERTAGRGR